MTTEFIEEAERQLEQFIETLETYDDPLVGEVAETLADSDLWSFQPPELEAEQWLDVLETAGDDLYLYAHEAEYRGLSDAEHSWYARFDGKFIYGTKVTGELYRGSRDQNAAEQINAVAKSHQIYPKPIERYPLEKADEFQEVPADE